jgi:hypothetical protein
MTHNPYAQLFAVDVLKDKTNHEKEKYTDDGILGLRRNNGKTVLD